ncbi:MAG: DNA repair protein RecO [Oscillospiraceae bacterium]|nr:DNA repair protein RecO [Oscillospiraceae bacterium]
MLFTYDGIVVGRREVGDNSCFIDILTDEQGIIEASAHGAKKMNSNLLSSASLFAYSTFCLNKTKLRYTVNSAKPKYSFHSIGSDIEKLALASYFAQAVRFCTPEEQTQDSMVRFFAIALFETNAAERLETVRSAFELRYSSMLGYHPDLRACLNCGCYEHAEMFFLPDSGELVCGDCFDRDFGGRYFVLPPETLSAMRNILYAPLDRAFRFKISGDGAAVLSRVTESYFLSRTERTFPALEYYKKSGIFYNQE